MYRVLRKKRLFQAGGILLFTVALFISLAFFCQNVIWPAGGEPDNISEKPVIILDAGHGGVDPGAIGVNQVREKDINLAITLCLRDMLLANGYKVVTIREDDISIHDPQYTKISQIKTSDLKNRLKIIESYPNAIALSIHQNKFGQSSSHGAQIFYGRNNENSQILAQKLQESFQCNLQPDNQRQIKRSTSDVYIIHNATIPIVLVECGFLSNPEDCRNLSDEGYQKKVAFTIFMGISSYRGEEPDGSQLE